MWDAGLGGSPAAICRYCKGERRQDAPRSPRPFGLRPGRSAAALLSLTISTYGLRRAPCIRSVLATTHHAPIYEIGSRVTTGGQPGTQVESSTRLQGSTGQVPAAIIRGEFMTRDKGNWLATLRERVINDQDSERDR